MLKQAKEKQLSDFCRRDAFGTKIAGYFKTYSDGFPGVRFWIQENGGNAVTAAVCRAYDSVVLSAAPEADFEELLQFLRMIGFSTLSCEESVCKRLGLSPTRSGNIVRFERLCALCAARLRCRDTRICARFICCSRHRALTVSASETSG